MADQDLSLMACTLMTENTVYYKISEEVWLKDERTDGKKILIPFRHLIQVSV